MKKKSKWSSKQYRDRSEMIRRTWADPEIRRKRIEGRSKAMKEWWADKKNYKRMLGVRREQVTTEQYKKKLSERMLKIWADPNFKRKMRRIRKQQANDVRNKLRNSVAIEAKWAEPEYRARVLESRADMYSDPDWRRKAAKGFQRYIKTHGSWNKGLTKETHPTLARWSREQQGNVPNWRKYGCWYKGINGKIWMRSSWEPAFAKWMDDNEIEWQYEKKRFYVGEGDWNGVTYTPDFYLPNQNQYVELKGWLDSKQKKKIRRFRQMYPEVKLWIFRRKHLKKILKKYRKKRKWDS